MDSLAIVPVEGVQHAAIPEVLDTFGVARLLRVHLTTVQDLAKRGQLPGRKVGKDYRFLRKAVLDWLSRQADSSQAMPRSKR